jgi:signal transduction histidine kinase
MSGAEDRSAPLSTTRAPSSGVTAQAMAGFAHEFRNPLAALGSILDGLIADSDAADARQDDFARMQRIVVRMERLVRGFLALGRPAPPEPADHDAFDLVRAALETLAPRLRGASPAVERSEPLAVHCDDGHVVQILVVLLDNALDAVGDPERLRLRVLAAGSRVRIEVEDDGPGIAPELLRRVFAPFYTTKRSGSGLGLSIARKLARENHGDVDASSAPGRTVFALELHGGGGWLES